MTTGAFGWRCHDTSTRRVGQDVVPRDDETLEVFADGHRLLIQRCVEFGRHDECRFDEPTTEDRREAGGG